MFSFSESTVGPGHHWLPGTILPVPACPPAPPDPWIRSITSQHIFDGWTQGRSPGHRVFRSPTSGGLSLARPSELPSYQVPSRPTRFGCSRIQRAFASYLWIRLRNWGALVVQDPPPQIG